MPIWSEVLAEINATAAGGVTKNFDAVRRKYLLELHEHTGRDIVLYASAWLQKEARPDGVSVNDEDIHGLSRHLPRSELEKMGMKVMPLEEDPVLQDTSLSVFHAAMLTMSGTPALKIVESHQGRAFIKSVALPEALSPIALDHPQSPPNAPTD